MNFCECQQIIIPQMLILEFPYPTNFTTFQKELEYFHVGFDSTLRCHLIPKVRPKIGIDAYEVCTYSLLIQKRMLPFIFQNKFDSIPCIDDRSTNEQIFQYTLELYEKSHRLNGSLSNVFREVQSIKKLKENLKLNDFVSNFVDRVRFDQTDSKLFARPHYLATLTERGSVAYRLNFATTTQDIQQKSNFRNSFLVDCFLELGNHLLENNLFESNFTDFLKVESCLSNLIAQNSFLVNQLKVNILCHIIYSVNNCFYREFGIQIRTKCKQPIPFLLLPSETQLIDLQNHLQKHTPSSRTDADYLLFEYMNTVKSQDIQPKRRKIDVPRLKNDFLFSCEELSESETESELEQETSDEESETTLQHSQHSQHLHNESPVLLTDMYNDETEQIPKVSDLIPFCKQYMDLMKQKFEIQAKTHDPFYNKTKRDMNHDPELKKTLRTVTLFLHFHTDLLKTPEITETHKKQKFVNDELSIDLC